MVNNPNGNKTPKQHGQEPQVPTPRQKTQNKTFYGEFFRMEVKAEVVNRSKNEHGNDESLKFLPHKRPKLILSSKVMALIRKHIAGNQGNCFYSKPRNQPTKPLIYNN